MSSTYLVTMIRIVLDLFVVDPYFKLKQNSFRQYETTFCEVTSGYLQIIMAMYWNPLGYYNSHSYTIFLRADPVSTEFMWSVIEAWESKDRRDCARPGGTTPQPPPAFIEYRVAFLSRFNSFRQFPKWNTKLFPIPQSLFWILTFSTQREHDFMPIFALD